jgi:nitroreductase
MKPIFHFKSPLALALALGLAAAGAAAQDLELPAPQKSGGMPLMEALAKRSSGRSYDSKELAPRQLSSLLWACFGINRPDGKRTAPSANDKQATDIYVLLPRGAYRYEARSNRLARVLAEDVRVLGATQAFATNAPVTLVFVADLARMADAPEETKKNMAAANVGYISQNAYLYCASAGLATAARASVDRQALAAKLSLRPEQWIVLAQSVGYPKP